MLTIEPWECGDIGHVVEAVVGCSVREVRYEYWSGYRHPPDFALPCDDLHCVEMGVELTLDSGLSLYFTWLTGERGEGVMVALGPTGTFTINKTYSAFDVARTPGWSRRTGRRISGVRALTGRTDASIVCGFELRFENAEPVAICLGDLRDDRIVFRAEDLLVLFDPALIDVASSAS